MACSFVIGGKFSAEASATNEELQSANEEVQSACEELQSTNEELETSKEDSAQMAIIILGPDLRIRRFTPMAEKLFNLVALDVGRAISDIKMELKGLPDLIPQTLERHIYDLGNGQWNIPKLRQLLTEVLPLEQWVVDFEVEHTFETIGYKSVRLNARRLAQG